MTTLINLPPEAGSCFCLSEKALINLLYTTCPTPNDSQKIVTEYLVNITGLDTNGCQVTICNYCEKWFEQTANCEPQNKYIYNICCISDISIHTDLETVAKQIKLFDCRVKSLTKLSTSQMNMQCDSTDKEPDEPE